MSRRLRGLVGALKEKATLLSSSASSASPHLAVLRATSHHPSADPPSPAHVADLLSFGRSSRLAATALAVSLSSRLLSTRDPSVALKSLLCLHHLLSRGAFILVDALSATLLPSSGRRNPLNLSSFPVGPTPNSFALSLLVRWYARLLELLLAAHPLLDPATSAADEHDRITSLLNGDLLRELDLLVGVLEEMSRPPEAVEALQGNRLVEEVVRLVKEDRLTAEHATLVGVREAGERLGGFGFADSVELVCLLRRLEECREKGGPSDGGRKGGDWFWREVREVRERVGEVVVKEEMGRVRRERAVGSARIVDRVQSDSEEAVRFGSGRWHLGG